MDKEKISEALSYLDDDIIKETDALRKKSANRHGNGIIDITRKPWFKLGLTAAAIVLILVGGGAVIANSNLLRKPTEAKKQFASVECDQAINMGPEGTKENLNISQNMTSRVSTTCAPTENYYDPEPVTAADGYSGNKSTGSCKEYNLEYISPFCNVSVNGQNVYGTYGFDISVEADYDVATGDSWELEVLKDGTWTSVKPKEETKWGTTSYSVGRFMGTRLSLDFNLDSYGYVKNGKYRIVKPITIHKTVEGNKVVFDDVVYCEFEIM